MIATVTIILGILVAYAIALGIVAALVGFYFGRELPKTPFVAATIIATALGLIALIAVLVRDALAAP